MTYRSFALLSHPSDEHPFGVKRNVRRAASALTISCCVFALVSATQSWAEEQKPLLTQSQKPLPVIQGPVIGKPNAEVVDLQIERLNQLLSVCKERRKAGQRYDLSSDDEKTVLKTVDRFQNSGELLCFAQDCWNYYGLSIDGYAPFGSYARVFLVAFWDCCDRFSVSPGKDPHDALVYLSQKVDTFSKLGIDVLIERQQKVK